MGLYPFNPNMGQQLQGDGSGITQDVGYIAHMQVAGAAATVASTTGIHAAITLLAAAQDITTAITQPSVPRCLSITGAMAGGSLTGDVVITGTDAAGDSLEETIALNDNATVVGLSAFKTVTNIHVPARVTEADTVAIGFTEALGLGHKLAHNTVLYAFKNNTKEGTAPTVTTSATVLALNTVDLNSALNSQVVDVYLVV